MQHHDPAKRPTAEEALQKLNDIVRGQPPEIFYNYVKPPRGRYAGEARYWRWQVHMTQIRVLGRTPLHRWETERRGLRRLLNPFYHISRWIAYSSWWQVLETKLYDRPIPADFDDD